MRDYYDYRNKEYSDLSEVEREALKLDAQKVVSDLLRKTKGQHTMRAMISKLLREGASAEYTNEQRKREPLRASLTPEQRDATFSESGWGDLPQAFTPRNLFGEDD